MKLYEITEKLQVLEAMLEEAEEDVSLEAIQDTLEAVEMELEEKVENILKLAKSFEVTSEAYKTERQRLQKLEQSAAKKAEQLKTYITVTLTQAGFDHKNKRKLQTSLGKVGFQKNPPTIEITDFNKVKELFPESFKGLSEDNFLKKPILDFLKKDGDAQEHDELDIPTHGVKWVNNRYHMRVR